MNYNPPETVTLIVKPLLTLPPLIFSRRDDAAKFVDYLRRTLLPREVPDDEYDSTNDVGRMNERDPG